MAFYPLFISPYFYINGNVNSRINTMFVNNLPKDKFFPIILGCKHSSSNDNIPILRPTYNNLFRLINKLLSKTKFLSFINELPDTYNFTWRKSAFKQAEQYIKKRQISYMHSISIPFTSHLLALSLKQQYGLPWIAQFYEPWADNQFRGYCDYTISKNLKWERMVAINADIIIHNSLKMCDSWIEKYGDLVAKKIFYLPMPSDLIIRKRNDIRRNNDTKFIISHIGNLYGKRSAKPFLLALSSFCLKYPSLAVRLNVNFVGYMQESDVKLVKDLNLCDIVRIIGSIDQNKCKDYYENSDLFLVIEGEEQGPLFFPSKVINYMYYDCPIIGITLKDSVLYDLLISNGHYAFRHCAIDDMVKYLHDIITGAIDATKFNHDAWKEYSINNVINEYCNLLNDKML